MAADITGTYSQAKDVFDTLPLNEWHIIDVSLNTNIPIFRKHLVEMQKRQTSNKRFVTRTLDKTQLRVKRIE